MKDKNQFYIAGKMFDSFEDGLKYEQVWLESIADQETFEILWNNLGKEIAMNIFLLGRQIPVKDLKVILEDVFKQFIGRSQGYSIKDIKHNLQCDHPGSKMQFGPTIPIEFIPIPERD